MKKIYLLLLPALAFCNALHAQPGAVGTNNLNGAPFNCTALTSPSGAFKQAQILATQSSAAVTWEFPASCGYPGDVWRPYAAGTGAVAFNTTIAPVGGTGSALYNGGNGGASGNLSSTTAGKYYTFNVENVTAPTNAYMAVLETDYNPVTISAVSNTTPANANNAVLVTCTTSGAPASGEYVYVRYSTDITFFTSSAISQFTFNGTTGQALIPCQAAGPVYYYVFSSNRTSAQIATEVGANGRISYDMLALNLNNNGGSNYTYTQGAGTNFGGVYAVPSVGCGYATVSAFVTALNGGTVTAPVTCYAIGGSPTETATAGGISITQTGTAVNPIVFKKFGSGSYIIQASSALTVGTLTDAIFKLVGADYITIDGFNLTENAANTISATGATNNMTEWGVALLHASVTDGAQNNTIQNNAIGLNKTYLNTYGIYSNVRHSATSITVTQDITNNTTGPNSNNKVYGNTISNVNMGMTFIGSGTSANQDVNNDIGGTSAATGNTISNWGGAAALSNPVSNSGTSYCIFVNHQTAENVSYNTITSAAVSGTAITIRGINKDYTTAAPTGTFTSTISNNTITMSSAYTSGTFQCIASQGTGTVSTVTVSITNNNLINSVLSGASTSSSFVGILHSWACGTVNITNNLIKGNTSTAATGGFTGIQNSGGVVTTVNINNNQVGDGVGGPITFSTATTGTVTGILNSGAAVTATVNINNNLVYGISCLSSGTLTGISNTGGPGATINIGTNTIQNITVSGVAASSAIVGINNSTSVGSLSITSNIIKGNTSTATTGSFIGIQNQGAVVTLVAITNNQVGDGVSAPITFSVVTSGQITGIVNSNAASTATVNLNNNTVDGLTSVSSGAVTGIWNLGGTGATVNINNNTVIKTVVNGVGASAPIIGINNSFAVSVLSMTGNITRSHTSTATTGGFTGIQNSGAVVNSITITGNQVGNASGGAVTYSVATTGAINGITNPAAAATATVNLNNNSIDGISLVTAGQVVGINSGGGSGVAININNNQLGSVTGTFVSFSGAQATASSAILSSGGTAATTLTIQGNDIKGIVQPVTGSNQYQLIACNSAMFSQNVVSNTFTNLNLNTTNGVYFIIRQGNMASGASWTCTNNSIVTGFNRTPGGNNVAFIYTVGSSAAGTTITETGNNFSNVTVTGATFLYGIYDAEGIGGTVKTISGNTFSNIAGGTGPFFIISFDNAISADCNSNVFSNISTQGDITAVYVLSSQGTGTINVASNNISAMTTTIGNLYGVLGGSLNPAAINISGNTISGLSASGANSSITGIQLSTALLGNIYDNTINNLTGTGTATPTANGIMISNGTTVNIYRNKINTLTESGAISSSVAVNGIVMNNGTTVNAYNNFISDLNTPNASLVEAIRGISVNSSSPGNFNLYYNSVYFNASTSGTNFGSSGIYHLAQASATTAALNMTDNIIVNTSTPKGTGVTAAYRRSFTTLNNYAAASDYNLFYTGTPSASRLIFYDGTNSDQTLSAYQTRVSTRDANSISLMPNFTSTTDLHLMATSNCAIDGAGTPIGSVLDDIDLQTRDVNTPDIGADEIAPTYSGTLAGIAGSATCENKNVSATGTTFATSSCNLIARVVPSGGAAVAGKINTCVTLDATQQFFNAEPYVQRHFDIEPSTANNTTTSATITLYFTDAEFSTFNTNNPAWPKLPTAAGGGSADPNRANLKVTQYHGMPTTTPSTPGNYTFNSGKGVYIDPADANIVWNGTYWAVTFNVTGFSGFYVHTNPRYALPITFNYLNGIKQSGKHLLNWKVTCTNTPRATLSLERSGDARSFSSIYSITADALRCQQPFDYTDAQPLAGMNYYRLKMMDADGKVTYSNIIALLNAAKGFDIVGIAPNPVVSETFKLNIASAQATKMNVLITDLTGRRVASQTVSLVSGYNSIDVIAGNLPAGTYNVSGITADDKTRVLRFVKK